MIPRRYEKLGAYPRSAGQRGVGLLEVVVAGALGALVVALSLHYLRAATHAQRVSTVSNAMLSYEESVRKVAMKVMHPFIAALVLGQPLAPPTCASNVSFPQPFKSSEHELDQCLTRTLPMGYSINLVLSESANPATPGSSIYQIYDRCKGNSTFGSTEHPHHNDTVIRFCVTIKPVSTQTTNTQRSALLSMQPIVVEMAYYNFFAAPTGANGYAFPTGSGTPNNPPSYTSPSVMSLRDLANAYPTGSTTFASPPPPIMSYLFYTFHWTSPEQGQALERHYSNFLVLGYGNG